MSGLRVAIVGCGLIGRKRAAALRPEDRVVAVHDAVGPAAVALGDELGAPVAESLDEVLAASPDLVIAATTHDALAEIGVSALESGADVLLEKPAGRITAEIENLIRVERETGRIAFVGFNHRFHPAVQRVLAEVASGEHGDVMYLRARYGHGGRIGYDREWRADPNRSGGGELVDQGFHLLDLSRCLIGEAPVASAFTSTAYWDMLVDDNAIITLGSPGSRGEPFANLHASCAEWKNLFDLEVYCRTAKLHLSGLQGSYGQQVLTIYRMKPEMGPPSTERFEFPKDDVSWQREWAEVASAIATRQMTSGDLTSALYCHRVADIAYGDVGWR